MFGWFTGASRREAELARQLDDLKAELEAVKATGGELLLSGRAGLPYQASPTFAKAAEQLQHFRGWPFACINAIASRCAGQSVYVGRKGAARPKQGKHWTPPGITALQSHPLLDLLADPSDIQIGWSLIYATLASLELTGRCLWYAPGDGAPEMILPIPTSWITGFVGTTSFEAFKVRPPGHTEDLEITADEACYFFYPSPADPRESASPLQAAAYAVSADESIQLSQVAGFTNGIFPRHALVLAKNAGLDGKPRATVLDGPQRRQLINSVREIYRGAAASGEPLIVGDGLLDAVIKLSATPHEMDWTASSQSTKARICQIFGVNPIILGEIESANRASSLAAEEHLAATLNPKLRLIGDTITEWLGPRYGDGIKVWFDRYEPRDAEMELRRWDLLARYGAPTLNELRAFGGLPPVEYGDVPIASAGGIDQSIAGMVDERLARVGAEATFGGKRINGHALPSLR